MELAKEFHDNFTQEHLKNLSSEKKIPKIFVSAYDCVYE